MATLITAFMFVAAFHFLYEGILLPTFRLSIRYQLYKLRDELRALKSEHADQLSDDAFRYLHNGINGTLKILPFLDIAFFREFNRGIRNNPEWMRKAEKRTAMLENCPVEGVQKIKNKLIELTFKTLALNTGGWSIYLTPLVLLFGVALFLIGLLTHCKIFLEKLLTPLVFSPERTRRFVPTMRHMFSEIYSTPLIEDYADGPGQRITRHMCAW